MSNVDDDYLNQITDILKSFQCPSKMMTNRFRSKYSIAENYLAQESREISAPEFLAPKVLRACMT